MATEEGGGHVRVCQYSHVLVVPDTCTHAPSLSVVLCLYYCVFGGTRIRRRLDWHTLPATHRPDLTPFGGGGCACAAQGRALLHSTCWPGRAAALPPRLARLSEKAKRSSRELQHPNNNGRSLNLNNVHCKAQLKHQTNRCGPKLQCLLNSLRA